MLKYSIPNLQKACEVLKHLSQSDGGLKISELCEAISIPRTTALRILSTLEHEGFVRQKERRYELGSGLIPVGMKALKQINIHEVSRPILAELARQTGETAHLAVPASFKSLILEVVDSSHPLRVASQPGTLVELYCSATGKVMLAYVYPDLLSEIYEGVTLEQRTPNTLTTIPALQREIERVRHLGYAVDNEEFVPGVRCVAAPVYDAAGKVTAAAGITGSTSRFGLDRLEEIAAQVTQAALAISRTYGY